MFMEMFVVELFLYKLVFFIEQLTCNINYYFQDDRFPGGTGKDGKYELFTFCQQTKYKMIAPAVVLSNYADILKKVTSKMFLAETL